MNSQMTAADKKYVTRTLLFMGGYAATNIAAITGAFDGLKGPATVAFALVVTAPIVGQIWSLMALMHESDEFVRLLMAKRFIVATGVTLAVASAWGFMELYAHAPHISAAMTYPLFWASFGVVSPFIRTSHP